MAILALDSFLRATSTGWGNASDGQTWVNANGAGTYAIGTGAYTISGSSATYGDGGTLTERRISLLSMGVPFSLSV